MEINQNRPALRLVAGLLVGTALGCCWPLFVCAADFRRLFLFQDEWDQLRQLDQEGLWRWAVSIFGENFMPVSKLAWAGTLGLFHGSYFAVIVAMWLTHALNSFLLGWLLWKGGCHPAGALLVTVLFGYSATMIETLAWSIQWSNVITTTFFLLALLQIEKALAPRPPSVARQVGLVLLLLGSALSFVRGIFCGLAVAGVVCLPGAVRLGWRRRVWWFGSAALPAVAVVGLMKLGGFSGASHGSHPSAEVLRQMASFALQAYAHNPVVSWWNGEVLSGPGLIVMLISKTGIFSAAVWFAPARLRAILLTLIFFEIANDMALGVGRFHTGLGAAGSSRYQYTSLVVFLPFIGVLFARLSEMLDRFPPTRTWLTLLTAVAAGVAVSWHWPADMRGWSGWRGGDLRAALALPREQAPDKLPLLEWISYDEAHALMKRHNLH